MKAWIAVDFDGTLAKYDGWQGPDHLGEPIPAMVERVKEWLIVGHTVKIFTARVGATGHGTDTQEFAEHQRMIIKKWCKEHIGVELEVTATKDLAMLELYDDRAVQVVPNTGELVGKSTRGF